MANKWGNSGNSDRLLCWGAPKSLQMVITAMKLKMLPPRKESYDQPRQHSKKQRHYFANKIQLVKAMVFPVVMYGCESWIIKKAECWRTDVLNCGVEKDSWESLGLQGDPTSTSWRKLVLIIHWKDWCWSWNSIRKAECWITDVFKLWCWRRHCLYKLSWEELML